VIDGKTRQVFGAEERVEMGRVQKDDIAGRGGAAGHLSKGAQRIGNGGVRKILGDRGNTARAGEENGTEAGGADVHGGVCQNGNRHMEIAHPIANTLFGGIVEDKIRLVQGRFKAGQHAAGGLAVVLALQSLNNQIKQFTADAIAFFCFTDGIQATQSFFVVGGLENVRFARVAAIVA